VAEVVVPYRPDVEIHRTHGVGDDGGCHMLGDAAFFMVVAGTRKQRVRVRSSYGLQQATLARPRRRCIAKLYERRVLVVHVDERQPLGGIGRHF
jgi:hypothetical protein